MKTIYLFLLSVLIFTSCGSEPDQLVKIEDRYTLSVPSILSPGTKLHENASLQYQNLLLEFYVVVIDEPRDEIISLFEESYDEANYPRNVEGYAKIVFDGLSENVSKFEEIERKKVLVNRQSAIMLSFTGVVEGHEVFYVFACVEGKERFYQVMSWTLAKKRDKYKEKMEKIMYSLKEL